MALNWNFAEPDWLREAPPDERMTYLDCPHAVFRRVLASCHDLPEEAWRRGNDPELMVRRVAARRPDTPPEVLERLVRAHGDVFHIRRPLLVEHPNFPRHTLRTLVDELSIPWNHGGLRYAA